MCWFIKETNKHPTTKLVHPCFPALKKNLSHLSTNKQIFPYLPCTTDFSVTLLWLILCSLKEILIISKLSYRGHIYYHCLPHNYGRYTQQVQLNSYSYHIIMITLKVKIFLSQYVFFKNIQVLISSMAPPNSLFLSF